MFHTIEFKVDLMLDLEVGPKKPLERMRVRAGARRMAQIRPYVMEVEDGPFEVADLFFDDGTACRSVPFACFRFVE